MAQGTIKKLTDKGFGFIASARRKDSLFHSSNVDGVRYEDLYEGQNISSSKPWPQGSTSRTVEASLTPSEMQQPDEHVAFCFRGSTGIFLSRSFGR